MAETADRTVTALFTVKFNTAQLKNGDAMIKRVTGALKVLGGAAGLGFAIKGLKDFTKNTALAFDEISKGARTISFSRKAFQEWQNTIELAGGSDRAFSKYVFFMQRGIAEAVNGLKTYSDAFDQLGLSPKDLQKLAPEVQFEKVFSALGRLEDQTVRNALAQRLLGRGGRELTVAMKEQLGMHEKNKIVLEQIGGVIKDEILIRSEAFMDRTIWLSRALRGLKARALDQILNIAEPFIDFMTKATSALNKWADETYMMEAAVMTLKAAMVIGALWITYYTWPILLAGLALGLLFLAIESVYTAMQGGESVLNNWVEAWTGKSIKTHVEEMRDALLDLAPAVGGIVVVWERLLTVLDAVNEVWDKLVTKLEKEYDIKLFDNIGELISAVHPGTHALRVLELWGDAFKKIGFEAGPKYTPATPSSGYNESSVENHYQMMFQLPQNTSPGPYSRAVGKEVQAVKDTASKLYSGGD